MKSWIVIVSFLIFDLTKLFPQPGTTDWSTTDYVNHVIVLIDQSGSMVGNLDPGRAREIFDRSLKQICFTPGEVIPNRKLLDKDKGDYLSILGFGINSGESMMKDFVHNVSVGGKAMYYYQQYDEGIFSQLWQSIEAGGPLRTFFNRNYTFYTFCKHMTFYRLSDTTDRKKIYRTFLIVISDELPNTSNPENEDKNWKAWGVLDGPKASNLFRKISRQYIQEDNIKINGRDSVIAFGPLIKLKISEYIPNKNDFDIRSLIEIPPADKMIFKRVRGGFELDYPLVERNKDQGRVESMQFYVEDASDGGIIRGDIDRNAAKVFLQDRYYQHPMTLHFQYHVRVKNEFYGAHVLHPDGSIDQGRKGLNDAQKVVFEAKRGLVGMGALGDMLYNMSAGFCGNNQGTNNAFWWTVILLLLAALFFLYLKKYGQIKEINDFEI